MKTKGINKSNDIDNVQRSAEFGSQVYHECSMKGMMISCFTYGEIGLDSYNFNRYILPYKELIPESFNEVYEEQAQYLEKCSVLYGVYTDHEGCTYNSIVEPNA